MFCTILYVCSVDLLLNSLNKTVAKKIKIYFSNITCDAIYHVTKFYIKTQLIGGEIKIKILLVDKLDQLK